MFIFYRISCVLIFFMFINGYSHQDISRRRTSNTCRDHSDCPTYAYCERVSAPTENGLCVCQEGYMIVAENKTRKCYSVASHIYEDCIFDEQCMYKLSTEAECRNQICQCRPGSHFVQREKECYKTSGVGEYCRLTNNCIIKKTICRDGICQCPSNTHLNLKNGECVPTVRLGEQCTADVECTAPNSRCHGVCRCQVSHIINADRSRCLKIADNVFNDCEEDSQCQVHIPHSICGQNKTCICRDGYHENNYRCFVTVKFGGICEIDENCFQIPGAVCKSGRCDCEQELYFDNDGECSLATKLQQHQQQQLIIFVITATIIMTSWIL